MRRLGDGETWGMGRRGEWGDVAKEKLGVGRGYLRVGSMK
jgi:hypothetical protein